MVVGDTVVASSTGQLGIVMSSARYKRDIHDMDEASSNLMKLRPVTFRYKEDPAGTLQYGLVAEEVAKLYPQLVSYGADGKVMTVRYLSFISMLLNELQKQNSGLRKQTAENRRQAEQLGRQAEQIKRLKAQVAEVEASTRRALDAQRAAFEERLSRLEYGMAARDGSGKLAAAFDR